MKRNLFYIIGVVCMMTSCVEEKFNQSGTSKNGEVSFSANLNNAITRTLYDADDLANSSSQDNSSIKVNWVHNDLISVYGAQCTAVKQAEYRVGTVIVDGNNAPTLDESGAEIPVSGQNYANYLNKTGAAGVQWGSATKSDFYAIYPSTSNSFDVTDNGAKVKTFIRESQTNVFEKTTRNGETIWVGTPYLENQNTPSMPDALMYACATDASYTEDYVDLKFKPWSTVLKFTFAGISYATGADMNTVTVSKITLTAPPKVDIVGDLELEIYKSTKKATARPLGDINNVVTIYPNHLPLSAGEKVEFCVYTIPQDGLYFGVSQDTDLWKVTIETSHGNFTYMMRPSSGNAELVAGAIHNINIPVKEVVKETDLPSGNWIEKIPRNVYLTELSVPGAWYSIDNHYQGEIGLNTDALTYAIDKDKIAVSEGANGLDDGLEKLYYSGVRAFHIDCRLVQNVGETAELGSQPTAADLQTTYPNLVCSGTEESTDRSGGSITNIGDLVASKLSTIASLIKPEEYVMVVLTIAEKPKDHSGYTFGTVDPSAVLPKIYAMLNDNTASYYSKIYKTPISSETLVVDVLNHMVVLINTNAASTNLFDSSYALQAQASMASSTSGNIMGGTFNDMVERDLYWGKQKTDLTFYYHLAQSTATSNHPSYAQREAAVEKIINSSDDIYKENDHNGFFEIGIGGHVEEGALFWKTTNTKKVANRLNNHLLTWVNNKTNGVEIDGKPLEPSPVGVVLMNYCIDPAEEDLYGEDLVKAIIKMNTKFYLNRDQSKPEWPTKSIRTTAIKSLETFDGYAEVEPLN